MLARLGVVLAALVLAPAALAAYPTPYAVQGDPGIGLAREVDRLQPPTGAEGLDHGALEEDPDLGAAVDQGAVDVEEDELPHEVSGATAMITP